MNAVMQRAAQRDVDFLNATANAKHRHARGDAGAHQRQHQCITARINEFIGGKRRPVVVMRFDVCPPTREHKTIHARHQFGNVDCRAHGRQQHGDAIHHS